MTGAISRKGGNEGVALIVALFAIIILSALVVAFASVARTDVLLAGNRGAMIQASYAAESSLSYCRAILAADDATVDAVTEDWALITDSPPQLDIPGFTVGAVVEDESARININTATRTMLMALPGMTDEAADSILDWRDTGDTPRPEGAESDYYLDLDEPYEAANAPFQTVDELRLVRGVDATLFEGESSSGTPPNPALGGSNLATSTSATPGLRDLVAVRSGERNVDAGGRDRLNINSTTATALSARLRGLLTAQEIAAVERRRSQGRVASLSNLLSISGVSWRRMAPALDRLRIDNTSFVEGTVNLNTAGEEVLVAIGLTDAVAQAVIERRAAQPLANKGELADVPGVTSAMMAAVADRVATKSSIFQVRAFAQADQRPLRAGVQALVDRSGQSPKIIQWREDFAPPTAVETGASVSSSTPLEQVNGS